MIIIPFYDIIGEMNNAIFKYWDQCLFSSDCNERTRLYYHRLIVNLIKYYPKKSYANMFI